MLERLSGNRLPVIFIITSGKGTSFPRQRRFHGDVLMTCPSRLLTLRRKAGGFFLPGAKDDDLWISRRSAACKPSPHRPSPGSCAMAFHEGGPEPEGRAGVGPRRPPGPAKTEPGCSAPRAVALATRTRPPAPSSRRGH